MNQSISDFRFAICDSRHGTRSRLFQPIAALLLWLLLAISSHAQWLTQSIDLKAGWNGVYLHVDTSHTTLNEMVGADTNSPIEEIWLWRPEPGTMQFIESPQLPTGGSPWASWVRSLGPSSELQRLFGNAAILVRVADPAPAYTWQVKGRPAPPRYEWTTTGQTFLGFPTVPGAPPSFESFLSKAPELQQAADIYTYEGGDLGTNNPAPLIAPRLRNVVRGEAYWIRAGSVFNRYFAPFELSLQSGEGIRFEETGGQYRFRLRNLVSEELTVSMSILASEAPPAGEESIAGTPPLLVRGELNTTDLTYPFTELNTGAQQWTLQPVGQLGSEMEVVLGLNRFTMTGAPGDFFAGALQFTDSLGFSRIDVPVSARVPSRSGLWVGQARVNQVGHYLRTYKRDASGQLVVSPSGSYVVAGTDTSLGAVARPYDLRLILHSDATGSNPSLLQRVYVGLRNGESAVATQESLLDQSDLDSARRISAVHLPWRSDNTPWAMTGDLQPGANATGTVFVSYEDQASNPFLHTYHPDHDNLNATFTQAQPQGVESYSIAREFTLNFTTSSDDFDCLTRGGEALDGTYEETVTLLARGSESREFHVRGLFSLLRITDVPVLATP